MVIKNLLTNYPLNWNEPRYLRGENELLLGLGLFIINEDPFFKIMRTIFIVLYAILTQEPKCHFRVLSGVNNYLRVKTTKKIRTEIYRE